MRVRPQAGAFPAWHVGSVASYALRVWAASLPLPTGACSTPRHCQMSPGAKQPGWEPPLEGYWLDLHLCF